MCGTVFLRGVITQCLTSKMLTEEQTQSNGGSPSPPPPPAHFSSQQHFTLQRVKVLRDRYFTGRHRFLKAYLVLGLDLVCFQVILIAVRTLIRL